LAAGFTGRELDAEQPAAPEKRAGAGRPGPGAGRRDATGGSAGQAEPGAAQAGGERILSDVRGNVSEVSEVSRFLSFKFQVSGFKRKIVSREWAGRGLRSETLKL